MRIDKFLWSIRFYKTRTIATEEIKKNRVSIGESVVKSSKEVKEGDVIKIRKNQIDYKIERASKLLEENVDLTRLISYFKNTEV